MEHSYDGSSSVSCESQNKDGEEVDDANIQQIHHPHHSTNSPNEARARSERRGPRDRSTARDARMSRLDPGVAYQPR